MNSKQIIEALNNGAWIELVGQFHKLIRFEGDKGRKLTDVTYWSVYRAVKLVKKEDGREVIA